MLSKVSATKVHYDLRDIKVSLCAKGSKQSQVYRIQFCLIGVVEPQL